MVPVSSLRLKTRTRVKKSNTKQYNILLKLNKSLNNLKLMCLKSYPQRKSLQILWSMNVFKHNIAI